VTKQTAADEVWETALVLTALANVILLTKALRAKLRALNARRPTHVIATERPGSLFRMTLEAAVLALATRATPEMIVALLLLVAPATTTAAIMGQHQGT